MTLIFKIINTYILGFAITYLLHFYQIEDVLIRIINPISLHHLMTLLAALKDILYNIMLCKNRRIVNNNLLLFFTCNAYSIKTNIGNDDFNRNQL